MGVLQAQMETQSLRISLLNNFYSGQKNSIKSFSSYRPIGSGKNLSRFLSTYQGYTYNFSHFMPYYHYYFFFHLMKRWYQSLFPLFPYKKQCNVNLEIWAHALVLLPTVSLTFLALSLIHFHNKRYRHYVLY